MSSPRRLADCSLGHHPEQHATPPRYAQQDAARDVYAADCEYGVSLKPSGAAKAGSPDCLVWPRGTARAFTVLPPDPVRRGEAGFDGRKRLAGVDLIMEAAKWSDGIEEPMLGAVAVSAGPVHSTRS
jgi:hypothetical protein